MINQGEIKADIIKNYLQWGHMQPQMIKLQRMTGITNAIYKAQVEGDCDAIIYRKFGPAQKNLFLCRPEEPLIYEEMSKTGNGPKIYFYDEKFRLQEFIESNVLQAKNMLVPGYLEQVALRLAHFHKQKLTAPQISKQGMIRKSFLNAKQKMLEICQNKLASNIYLQEQLKIVEELKTWVSQDELIFIEKLVKQYEAKWELVFSHNDLLSNNILVKKNQLGCTFIDFQYAAYNFPFYDIANYFQESQICYQCNDPPFFSFVQPHSQIDSYKVRFIDAYVVARDFSQEDFRKYFEELRKLPKCIQQREKLAKDIGVGRLLCNLMWGWWSIIMSKNPEINFDYISYAKWRYQNYLSEKKALSL